MDIHDVKTQHFKEMLYNPIILVMEIHELCWPNLDMVEYFMDFGTSLYRSSNETLRFNVIEVHGSS